MSFKLFAKQMKYILKDSPRNTFLNRKKSHNFQTQIIFQKKPFYKHLIIMCYANMFLEWIWVELFYDIKD